MQSIIAINWPLLILTDSPEFPRKLTKVGTIKMCGMEAKVTNRRFDGNWGNLYVRDLSHSIIILLSRTELDAFRLLVLQGKSKIVGKLFLQLCKCNLLKYQDIDVQK